MDILLKVNGALGLVVFDDGLLLVALVVEPHFLEVREAEAAGAAERVVATFLAGLDKRIPGTLIDIVDVTAVMVVVVVGVVVDVVVVVGVVGEAVVVVGVEVVVGEVVVVVVEVVVEEAICVIVIVVVIV